MLQGYYRNETAQNIEKRLYKNQAKIKKAGFKPAFLSNLTENQAARSASTEPRPAVKPDKWFPIETSEL